MIRIPSLIFFLIIVLVSSGGLAEETSQPPGSTSPETGGTEPSSSQTNSGTESTQPGSGSKQDQGPTSSQPSGSGSSSQDQPAVKQQTNEPSQETAPGAAPNQPSGPSATPGEQAAPKSESAAKVLEASEEEKKRTVSTAEEQTGATLIKGRLELDLALTYTHNDSNQLFIEGFGILPILTVGNVTVNRIRRDTWTSRFSVRYKLTTDLQLSVTIPYQYTLLRKSEAAGITSGTAVAPTTDDLSRGYGLGDVSGSLDYQLFNEAAVRPAIYVSLSFTARTGRDAFETEDAASNPPTGSGFNVIGVSTSFVKVADPAVVSGSLSYSYPIPRNNVAFMNNGNPVLVDLNPGSGIGTSLGLAYALNYKVSISTSISQSISLPTYVNGKKLQNSTTNNISVAYGLTWRWTDKTSLAITVTQGLTLDSPNAAISFRVPYRF